MSTEAELKEAEAELFRATLAGDPARRELLVKTQRLRDRFSREVNGRGARPAAHKPAPPSAGDRCLSVRQPWASLIIAGAKRVENRSWSTDYRGTLFIHAAASRPRGSWADIVTGAPAGPDDPVDVDGFTLPAWSALPCGAILGSVELFDCVDETDLPAEWAADPFAGGPVCWLLRDPRPLAAPFPCSGALRLWKVPEGVARAERPDTR